MNMLNSLRKIGLVLATGLALTAAPAAFARSHYSISIGGPGYGVGYSDSRHGGHWGDYVSSGYYAPSYYAPAYYGPSYYDNYYYGGVVYEGRSYPRYHHDYDRYRRDYDRRDYRHDGYRDRDHDGRRDHHH
jgi:hypothetical protein